MSRWIPADQPDSPASLFEVSKTRGAARRRQKEALAEVRSFLSSRARKVGTVPVGLLAARSKALRS